MSAGLVLNITILLSSLILQLLPYFIMIITTIIEMFMSVAIVFEPRIKFYEIRYFYASAFRCQRHYFSGCPSVRTSVGLINHYPGDRPTEQPGKTKTPDQAQRRLTNCAIWYADVSWPTPGLIRFWSWFAELKKNHVIWTERNGPAFSEEYKEGMAQNFASRWILTTGITD